MENTNMTIHKSARLTPVQRIMVTVPIIHYLIISFPFLPLFFLFSWSFWFKKLKSIGCYDSTKSSKIKIDEVIESVKQFPIDSLPLDNNPAMLAALARGQRKKLSMLILNCYNYLLKSGIKEEALKKALSSLSF